MKFKTGLVLSGGGTRGFAHIGALLIEPVDIAGFGYLGSKRGMEMYRIGYDAAKKQLETFKNW
jgi:hypothetical protein